MLSTEIGASQKETSKAPTGHQQSDAPAGKARLKRIHKLSRPFWASFIIGAVSLLVFAAFLVNALDRQAITSSERVMGSVLGERLDRLSELTLEYAFWDESVDRLVNGFDEDWIETTFVDYIYSDLGIIGVHVLDGENTDRLHVYEDAVTDGTSMKRYGPDAEKLINRARRTPTNETPIPATGFLGAIDDLYLASAARMTTYDAETDTSTDHVMMFVRPLDDEALADLGEKFQLPGLQITTEDPSYFQAHWPIRAEDGTTLANFVWNPVLPGQRLLPPLALGLIIVYAGMMIAARAFLKQAMHMVSALDAAKRRTERAKELLAHQANTDALTNLGNRWSFEQTLDTLSAKADGTKEFALVCFDLDRFKTINDTLGHETGDEVLKYVGETLSSLTYPQDKVFRLGGDEFVIVFGLTDRERVLAVAKEAISILSQRVTLNGHSCHFGASAGIAYSTEPVNLLRRADTALYASKKKGRGQVTVYIPDSTDTSAQRLPATETL
ncbi:sensor domain-containing diguanylate cyclase [Roseibium alexandrii]|uniref:Putative diguanylate cyclase YegE n=1 Tax=Roseibium alexandrii TaxID=388408 RepID=A0A0M7AE93_9HYPH|nr:diguanylate cyclase [Roseibium alexandrii]CTQ72951.1 putative diguanylate cyclase YegE [Roseibium alexandrii]